MSQKASRTPVGLRIDEATMIGLKALALHIRRNTGVKISATAIIRASLAAVVAAELPVEPFTSEAAAQAFLTARLIGTGTQEVA